MCTLGAPGRLRQARWAAGLEFMCANRGVHATQRAGGGGARGWAAREGAQRAPAAQRCLKNRLLQLKMLPAQRTRLAASLACKPARELSTQQGEEGPGAADAAAHCLRQKDPGVEEGRDLGGWGWGGGWVGGC